MKTNTINYSTVRNIVFAFLMLFSFIKVNAQLDLRDCGYGCTSNSFSITDVFLSATEVLPGVPLTNTSCVTGEPQMVYMIMTIESNRNADVYHSRFFADLHVGNSIIEINQPMGTLQSSNNGATNKFVYGPFTWICGEELTLENTLVVWKASPNNPPDPNNYECNDYSQSQCQFPSDLIVSTPLAVEFEYTACTTGNIAEVQFVSTTSGGTTPYTYSWNYDGGTWVGGSASSPIVQYNINNGPYNPTLIVTDVNGNVNVVPYSDQLVFPSELENITSFSNAACTGSDGSASFTAIGGTAPYNFTVDSNTTGGSTLQNGPPTTQLSLINAGAGTIMVTITDAANCSVQESITIILDDTENPIITAPDNYTIEGCDTDAITSLVYSEVPVSITINELENALGGNGTASDDGTISLIEYSDLSNGSCPLIVTRTFTVTDSCGKTSNDIQIITIEDTTNPTFDDPLPTDITVECDNINNPEDIKATDLCGTPTVTFNEVRTDGSCDSEYTLERTWTATDCAGNSTSHTQTITVQDTTAPTFNEVLPSDATVECDKIPSDIKFSAKDNCDLDVKVEYEEVRTDGACDSEYTLERTWTATDCAGNSTSHTQTITVQDTTNPTFNEALPTNATVECDNVPAADTLTAADNCDTSVTVNFNEVRTDGACDSEYKLERTWTAIDCAGNSTSHTQTITVQDTTDPTFNEVLPTDVTVECDNVPADIKFSASDNCDLDVKVEFEEVRTDSACDSEYTLERTWTATDCAGNSISHTQTITVQDTTAPTFNEALPADTTVECDNVPAADTLTANDNCDTSVTVNFNEVRTDGACDSEYTLERTWTATDCAGNSTLHTQTINVQDTADPTLSVPADATVECTDSTEPAATGTATGSDSCGTVTITYIDAAVDTCGNTQIITRTWTATDECGNDVSADQIITVVDTTDPILSVPADATVECTDSTEPAATGTATGSDSCGTVTITYTDAAVDTCGNTQTITRTWTATDECGNDVSADQIITVVDTTDPTLSVPADATVECTDSSEPAATGTATGSDSCGTVTITYTDTAVDTCGNTQTITRTWTATDECGNDVSADQIITVVDTTDPILSVPADATVECTDSTEPAATGTATGSDSCGTVTITYTDAALDTCGNTQTITRTWTATDECGNDVSADQIITVVDTTDPTIDVEAGDIVVECDGSGNSGAIQAWLDANGGASASDSCGSVTWTNNYGGAASDCAAPIEVIFTATDECGNSTTTSATYAIMDNIAPTIDVEAGDLTVECDGSGNTSELQAWLDANGGASGSDDCSAIAWSNDFTTLSDDCGATGSATVIFTITDGCGNSSTTTATFTIEDTIDPTFNESLPANITVECDSVPNADTLTADDSCGTATVVLDEVRTDGSCDSNYTLVRTWTATDECGNTTTHSQTLTIQDTTAPTFNETLPSDVTEECDAATDAATLTASDNCGTADVTFDEVRTDGSCPSSYTLVRTWTATDECGLTTSHTQTVTIQDTTAPTFNETLPSDVTEECDAVTDAATLTADDNCGTADVTFDEVRTDGSCPSNYTLVRTWTATDECGLTTSHTQTVTVQDTTAPTIDIEAGDIMVECDGSGNSGAIQAWLDANGSASASDNCGIVTWTNNYGGATSDCAAPIEVVFTATDECGNSTTTSATYAIMDNIAPTIDIEAGDLTVECDGLGNDTALQDWLNSNAGASASDDCSAIAWSNDFSALTDDCGATGSATVTFTVTDGCGNTSITTATFTIEDNTAPTFNESLPADETVECDAVADAVTLTAADNCGTADVTFTETTADGSCPGAYVLTRTWTATDECGNTTIHTQTVTVEDTTAPTFNESLPADETVECDALADALTLTAADNCGTADVTFTETTADGSCPNAYVLTRTWTATDLCGLTTIHTQTVTVDDNTAPTIDVEAEDIILVCSGQKENDIQIWLDANGGASATDNCGSVTWTNNYTGITSDCTDPIEVIFTATDECGNSTNTMASFAIADNTDPTIDVEASNLIVECNGSGNADALQNWLSTNGGASAYDDCSANIIWSNNFDSLSNECGITGFATVIFIATDSCGNSSTTTATFTIEDTTAPTFNESLPADETVECDAVADAVTLTAADNCGIADVTFTETTADGSCPNAYVLTRTWTATDECGNTTIHTQTVTVEDNTAPTFNESLPADETVECDAVADAVTLTAIDSCQVEGDRIVVTFTEETTEGSCPSNYIVTRTWTASDDCGNSVSHTQTITVQDTTAPIVTTDYEDEISVSCGDIPETPELEFEDACSTDITVEFEETSTFDGSDDPYQIIRIWTVTDECNNIGTYTQTISVSVESQVEGLSTDLCNGDDIQFDLFALLDGDYEIGGTWTVTSGNATIDGSIFNPYELELGTYIFTYVDDISACPSETTVTLILNDDCIVLPCGDADEVIISKAVTANGDQWNEYFEVTGIEGCGFTVEVQIFNRWGAMIYESKDYQNNWNAFVHGSSVGGSDKVPTGTYYYIINLKDSGLKPFAGPIYVGTK